MNLVVENAALDYIMKRTEQRVLAFEEVNFSIRSGHFVTIVGPSGCGKTSLLLAIAGLRRLRAGRIALNGRTVEGPGREVAVVFQSPALLP